MSLLSSLSARVRNLFFTGELKHRYDDGKIQVQLVSTDSYEKKEPHFYGFKALAKKGAVFVFAQGGDFNSLEFLPVMEQGEGPDLKEGDAALYTESGGWIICRDSGEIEILGKNFGGLIKVEELQTQLEKLTARVDGIINALRNSLTLPQDGGSTYKAGIVSVLSEITDKENFSSIASDKVFHGNGS